MAARTKTTTVLEETVSEHARRITMLEDVFAPMAKLAMELIVGKPGEPGMAEDMRNVRADLKGLVDAHASERQETVRIRADGFKRLDTLDRWRKQVEDNKQAEKEIRLMGIKVNAETRIAVINGAFILAGTLLARWLLP